MEQCQGTLEINLLHASTADKPDYRLTGNAAYAWWEATK